MSKKLNSLVNKKLIENLLKIPYASGHNQNANSLGLGLIYYFLPYAFRLFNCVCIGSGGGFVPALMRQAQRDAKLYGSRTILIDGVIPEVGCGSPLLNDSWMSKESFFNKNYQDVEIIISSSDECAKLFFKKNRFKINYLHIDGDHSQEQVENDLSCFLPLMDADSFLTIHDFGASSVQNALSSYLKNKKFNEILKFEKIGAGLCLIKINNN